MSDWATCPVNWKDCCGEKWPTPLHKACFLWFLQHINRDLLNMTASFLLYSHYKQYPAY